MQALEKLNPPQENTDTSAELPVALKPKRRFTASPLFVLGLALGLAVLMWAFNFQPVNSDTTKLVAVYDSTANLLDPNSPVWNPDRIDPASNEVDADSKPTQKVSTTVVPLS